MSEEKLSSTPEQEGQPQLTEPENSTAAASEPPAEGCGPSKTFRTVQRIAIILLVSVIAATALLTVLPQTRGPFLSWVRKGREVYHVYSYNGDIEPLVYRPTWLPEGYELEAVYDTQQVYTYKSNIGTHFSYTCYNLKKPYYEHTASTLDFVKGVSEVRESSVGSIMRRCLQVTRGRLYG